MAPTLNFLDLPKHFPKEVRQKIYLAYFQPPKGHFVYPDLQELFEPIEAVRETDRTLYDEILDVARFVPSTPQTIKLESCCDNMNWLWLGSPKRIMTGGDWMHLHYLVIKIKFVDVSFRDEDGTCAVIHLGLSRATGQNLRQLLHFQKKNPCLWKLKQVRYDFEYGDENSESQVEQVMPLAIFVAMWPGAVSVWAEAVGKNMHPSLLEAVRGFNFARRAMWVCPVAPDLLSLDFLAATAGSGATYEGKDFNWVAVWDFAEGVWRLERCEQYWVTRGMDMVIRCPDCFAEFKNSRPIGIFPEEVYLTKMLWEKHLERAERNNKALGCKHKENGEEKCQKC